MRVEIKPGVILGEINYFLLTLCHVLYEVMQPHGVTPTITSGVDGQHMPGSLHDTHKAWDIRAWGFLDPQAVFDEIREKLRLISPCWQVLFGDQYHRNHAHIEFDVKQAGG